VLTGLRQELVSVILWEFLELQSAIQKFTVRGPLNTRAGTRISSSIRYLQQVNVTFWLKKASEIPETKSFVQNLYTAMTHESKHFFAYTDGSTNPKVHPATQGVERSSPTQTTM